MSSPPDAPLGSPGSPGGNILVVDDDPVTRRVLSSILERAHYDVMASTDGHEAWTELAAARIDLVITDREMPAMNGVELLRAVSPGGIGQVRRHAPAVALLLSLLVLALALARPATDSRACASVPPTFTRPCRSRVPPPVPPSGSSCPAAWPSATADRRQDL